MVQIAHHPCIDFELSLSLPAIGAVTGGVAASIIYGLASTSGDDEETGAAGQPLLGSREQSVPAVSLPLLNGRF